MKRLYRGAYSNMYQALNQAYSTFVLFKWQKCAFCEYEYKYEWGLKFKSDHLYNQFEFCCSDCCDMSHLVLDNLILERFKKRMLL